MLTIDTKPSPFSADNTAFARHPPRSIHGPNLRRQLDRITYENQGLLMRLQSVKSDFDLKGLEDREMDRQALKHRIVQNSCRGRSLNLPMPQKPVMNSMPNLPRMGQAGRMREDDWIQ